LAGGSFLFYLKHERQKPGISPAFTLHFYFAFLFQLDEILPKKPKTSVKFWNEENAVKRTNLAKSWQKHAEIQQKPELFDVRVRVFRGGEGGNRTLAGVYFDAPRQSSLAKIQQAAGGTLILTEE
jgi:hypothetical protein